MKQRSLLLTGTILVLSALSSFSQVPRTISYQGVLADPAGNFIPDGVHAVSISLYESPIGGSSLFTEVTTVAVVRGVFTVIVDSTGDGIPPYVSFDRAYFLGISVDGGTELQPRTAMTAAPYAFRSIVADRAESLAPGASGAVSSINNAEGAIRLEGAGGTSVTNSSGVITITSSQGSTGPAGGDLAGTYPNPTIATGAVSDAKIANQGVGLTKLSRSGAAAGYVLGFDGTQVAWRPD